MNKKQVYVSNDRKNWIFTYTRTGVGNYFSFNGTPLTWVEAHDPVSYFNYAKVVYRDENNIVVSQEVVALK